MGIGDLSEGHFGIDIASAAFGDDLEEQFPQVVDPVEGHT
jgi:hypothetical protein